MGCGIFVIGPAGSGKTSLAHMLKEYYKTSQNRKVLLVNLDPAQALDDLEFEYDIRDHIEISEIMEEADFGPNGGLLAGVEAVSENMDIMNIPEDDEFLIFDCPGQIELYIHSDSISRIVREIGKYHSTMIIYAVDATHTMDPNRFVSAAITAAISMNRFEVPHINILTKCDLVDKNYLDEFLFDMDVDGLLTNLTGTEKEKKFNTALISIVRDQGIIGFIPLNYKEADSLEILSYQIDNCLQYYDNYGTDKAGE